MKNIIFKINFMKNIILFRKLTILNEFFRFNEKI